MIYTNFNVSSHKLLKFFSEYLIHVVITDQIYRHDTVEYFSLGAFVPLEQGTNTNYTGSENPLGQRQLYRENNISLWILSGGGDT